MTWPTVTAIFFIPLTLAILLAWHALITRYQTQKHVSDNEVKMAELAHKTAVTPRNIFGLPTTPAAAHHSGGIGKAQVKPQ